MKTLSPGLGDFLYVKTKLTNNLSPYRYKAFPKYADQIITMMRTAVSKKLTNHRTSMEVISLWISYSTTYDFHCIWNYRYKTSLAVAVKQTSLSLIHRLTD